MVAMVTGASDGTRS